MADDANEAEARAAYARLVATRERVQAGEVPWSALMDHFTDDAVFVDPAWGRAQGREHLVDFFDRSMRGLEDWTFPEVFTMVEGHRVVSMWWNRLGGARDDGTPFQAPGISVLHYAGDGKFSFEMDVLNMAEVMELLGESGWSPPPTMEMPPSAPDRNPTPPHHPAP